MNVHDARGYGIAASDAEGNWDADLKKRLKKEAFKTVLKELNFFQKIQLAFLFPQEKKRLSKIDISEIRKRGMSNENFLTQQIEYLAVCSTLMKILDEERALKIMHSVMDNTADALLTTLPEIEEVKKSGDPVAFFNQYIQALPEASRRAGCHEMTLHESAKEFEFDVHYCVWYELAKTMEIPRACLPNCYADDLVYPEYFKSLGIEYSRSGTLAQGKKTFAILSLKKLNDQLTSNRNFKRKEACWKVLNDVFCEKQNVRIME